MGDKNYLKLKDIDAYKIAFHFSNDVWDLVIQWDNFEKKTIGAQFVDAADSVSANVAEGSESGTKRIMSNFTGIAKVQGRNVTIGTKRHIIENWL